MQGEGLSALFPCRNLEGIPNYLTQLRQLSLLIILFYSSPTGAGLGQLIFYISLSFTIAIIILKHNTNPS